MTTYSAKPKDVTREWYVVDASELSLGRLSTNIAELLMGKGKPMYTAHIDCGDYVVVINAAKLKVTGNKLTQKKYYRHSQYPGSLRESSLEFELQKDPTNVVRSSIRGMLPANKLRDQRLARLKIYVDQDHSHEAQKPKVLSFRETKK